MEDIKSWIAMFDAEMYGHLFGVLYLIYTSTIDRKVQLRVYIEDDHVQVRIVDPFYSNFKKMVSFKVFARQVLEITAKRSDLRAFHKAKFFNSASMCLFVPEVASEFQTSVERTSSLFNAIDMVDIEEKNNMDYWLDLYKNVKGFTDYGLKTMLKTPYTNEKADSKFWLHNKRRYSKKEVESIMFCDKDVTNNLESFLAIEFTKIMFLV